MITEYGFNSKYLLRDGEPWFPVMGEMQYSRVPRAAWNEGLRKMKAGGVDIVSSYVIWIHHEEIEDETDFTGNLDLRAFIRECQRVGMVLFLRIGPWVHGEVRNGGLPDWLLAKDFTPRTNDPAYLAQARRFYEAVFAQAKGLLHKDGGPVIGVQIENEYGHVGGLTGQNGERHMYTLRALAAEVGFDVPYYTATGWGGAVTGGLLPVMGGYCDAPWDPRLTELPPSVNYIFTHERDDHNIGSDHVIGTERDDSPRGVTFDVSKFPYLTAELGGGLQPTHHRRPVALAADIAAMSVAKLGSGVNLLGYYMYHGGTNPHGKLTSLQETRATGYPNDLPALSYDFRAPIREYGQIGDTFREIKLLAMFVHDFGAELCGMDAVIQNPVTPEDCTALRTAVRHNGHNGYVFVNNFQRRRKMAAHQAVRLRAELGPQSAVEFEPVDIADGDFMFYPFDRSGGFCATPLCRINGRPVYYTDQALFTPADGGLVIARRDALDAWKLVLDREYLVISRAPVIPSDAQTGGNAQSGYEALAREEALTLRAYPAFTQVPEGFVRVDKSAAHAGEFAEYTRKIPMPAVSVGVTQKSHGIYEITLEGPLPESLHDYFLTIDFAGDGAELYLPDSDEPIADTFYTGEPWEVGLRRFGFPSRLRLVITPLYEGAEVYLERWPAFVNGEACGVHAVTTACEKRVTLW